MGVVLVRAGPICSEQLVLFGVVGEDVTDRRVESSLVLVLECVVSWVDAEGLTTGGCESATIESGVVSVLPCYEVCEGTTRDVVSHWSAVGLKWASPYPTVGAWIVKDEGFELLIHLHGGVVAETATHWSGSVLIGVCS